MKRLFAAALACALGACSSSSPTTAPADAGADAPAAAAWTPVLQGLDGALLGMWGPSERDLWAVGGPLGNSGHETLVVHFDGSGWTRARPGGDTTTTYWWVHGTGPSDVWLVGEKGRITHYDGTAFEEKASGTTATLFGVWAAAPDDAWAVGGTPDDATAPNAVVLHWDGKAWSPVDVGETKKVAFFKVWGAPSGDLYVVGDAGTLWHRAGGAWRREAEGLATGRLTTVTGCAPDRVYAVGGRDVLAWDGKAWSRADVLLVNDVNGVACAPKGAPERAWGDVVVVGGGSLKLWLVGGAWQSDFGSEPYSDLHGAFVDATGALWGVGGNFNARPQAGASREGVVARFGDGVVPSALAP